MFDVAVKDGIPATVLAVYRLPKDFCANVREKFTILLSLAQKRKQNFISLRILRKAMEQKRKKRK